MVDKSKAEENAIAEAFGEGVKILLCDVHRLQAWWRYIIAGHNGVKKEHQAELYYDLRAVANAMSFVELESRLQHLKQSPAWKSNPKVRYWLESHWLNCMPAWVAGHRTECHGGQNTNNHLEAMNRVFKAKWLGDRHDKRLDSLLQTYMTVIIPFYIHKYRRNQMLSISFTEQMSGTPSEMDSFREVCVRLLFDDAQSIKPSLHPCKHIFAVLHHNQWTLEKLPSALLAQPHLLIDYHVLPSNLNKNTITE
eukprot:scaffold145644_cov15-Tisochrysis_lutea.AAC.1